MSRFPNAKSLVVKLADFPSFLESDLGLNIRWAADRESGKCLCPLHGDSDPSFGLKNYDDGWGFNCFGCNSKGTVVEFFMHYYGMEHDEAVASVAERFEINIEGLSVIQETIKAPIKTGGESFNMKKLTEFHAQAATQCRLIMRKRPGDGAIRRWIEEAFERMDDCIENCDAEGMEKIYLEASKWNT